MSSTVRPPIEIVIVVAAARPTVDDVAPVLETTAAIVGDARIEELMTVERIAPSDVYPPFNDFYSQVIRATGATQIHVAGMVSMSADRELVGEGDVRAQTRTTMENIGRSLAAAGATPADVVRINIFTLDVDRYLQEAHQEVVAFFGDTKPTSTLVGVTRLADPRYLVEIQATAVVD